MNPKCKHLYGQYLLDGLYQNDTSKLFECLQLPFSLNNTSHRMTVFNFLLNVCCPQSDYCEKKYGLMTDKVNQTFHEQTCHIKKRFDDFILKSKVHRNVIS